MIGLLNLGSLILGLIAWIVPVISLMRIKKENNKNDLALSVISLSSCAISLTLQISSISQMVKIQDSTAILDTIDSTVFVSMILVAVTIILNIVHLFMYRRGTS
ncbi:MAG TPA: hypothetical protein GXZ58_02585 [Bacilli bacterium]|nr:hypothetical protein [Bacilli bacterium]